jgi:prophage antirepressor-like protein
MFSSIVGKGGMEQLFENKELNVSVRTVRRDGEVLFYAKDVAESLGYINPQKATRDHVWEEDKYTLGSFKGGSPEFTLCRGQPNTVLITEQGVYQLIFGSELKPAKEFRRCMGIQ